MVLLLAWALPLRKCSRKLHEFRADLRKVLHDSYNFRLETVSCCSATSHLSKVVGATTRKNINCSQHFPPSEALDSRSCTDNRRYNYELQTSEMFSTAGRSVKSGLVASAVVSSWTWAATLLQSSAVAYNYGVSGPFWYASGATVQIILFATIAIELKRRAPNAHTFLEVIRARYGAVTHIVFMVFGLFTNILVTSMLLTGGSAVVTTLTGVPTAAACFLLPIGVVLYTMFGGIKATFLTDYAHTVVILIILLLFAFTAYATNENLGSPGKVYDLLVEVAKKHPVEGTIP